MILTTPYPQPGQLSRQIELSNSPTYHLGPMVMAKLNHSDKKGSDWNMTAILTGRLIRNDSLSHFSKFSSPKIFSILSKESVNPMMTGYAICLDTGWMLKENGGENVNSWIHVPKVPSNVHIDLLENNM
jgi:hypothetical protein